MAYISVYDKNETDFLHNGVILPDAISCIIEEELNGKYELELQYPIDEQGKWKYLVEENIIKADGQLFRIYSIESNLGYITVFSRHIFYDLLFNFLEDVKLTNVNGAGALSWILSHTQYPHKFTSMSDVQTINTQYFVRVNPVEAILGKDGLVNKWGGEIVRDNFVIKLLNSRGQDKGAQIVYGKNMLGLEVQRNMDTVITRLMPVGRDELLLPEKYVDSPLINRYAFPRVQKIEFDIGIDDETTEEQAIELLRAAAKKYFEETKCDIPYININANLLLLENTEEYKHLKNLVRVNLGDIVSCTDNPLNITFTSKVIRVKKDVLSNKNVEVELGHYKKGIGDTIQNEIINISDEIKHNTSYLESAIENATKLLTNALGGYVLKRPGELLIMDTEDPATATKVWRWNLNGLGYSDTGINGPYRLAMTIDGHIVADFIDTGTLTAALIKTGILKSADNSSWINMDNGTFNFKNVAKYENGQFTITSNHSDGSYTTIAADGIKRHIGDTATDYHYLTYVGSGMWAFINAGLETMTLTETLPDEFKGKNFKVYVSVKSFKVWDSLIKTVYVEAVNIDQANGKFSVYIEKNNAALQGSVYTTIIEYQYIVIA
ncbi:phage tail spike protein [Clostridium thermosuccinogenes]|uniref:phage tail spike protein n=1 Tax=Clostridium thermosuccinogenes TaxID=84032 RepID=UPI000CCC72B3|nr:phage tail spike protein [Pseudoclostridium thermosuccinogenes]PNT94140.1 hypothetical protein CDQ83_11875 [Pseudoclostridium thermosuccinogenes]